MALLTGCTPALKKPVIEAPRESWSPPAGASIKARASGRNFDQTNYKDVWDALITVMMQKAPILYLSIETGVLCTARLNILVEPGLEETDTVMVYMASGSKNDPLAKDILDSLATQLYAGEKWKYLYNVTFSQSRSP
jgi:hypothetical protein